MGNQNQHVKGFIDTKNAPKAFYKAVERITRCNKITGDSRVIINIQEFKTEDIFTNRQDALYYYYRRVASFNAPNEPSLKDVYLFHPQKEYNYQEGDTYSCSIYFCNPESDQREICILGENGYEMAIAQRIETEYFRTMFIESLIQGTVNKQVNWHTEVIKRN